MPVEEYFESDLRRAIQKRKRSPIRSAGGKPRPKCRQVIIQENLVPYPHPSVWDGYQAWGDPDDRWPVMLSDGMKAEMRRMIVEGYWAAWGSLLD